MTYKVRGPGHVLVQPGVQLCLSEAEDGPSRSVSHSLVISQLMVGQTPGAAGGAPGHKT